MSTANSKVSGNYHGVKPVTDDDKDLAEKHLKMTKKLKEKAAELVRDKIEDHEEAAADRKKDKSLSSGERKRSINYNNSHSDHHQHEEDEIDKEQAKIGQSLKTLGQLRTHSRRTYNQVRKQSVKLMYRKAGVKSGS